MTEPLCTAVPENKHSDTNEKNCINGTETYKTIYIGFRYLEGICIAVFVFGLLWEGAEILKLTLPEFLILYGGAGALVSEIMARFTLEKVKKKSKVEAA